VLTRLSHSHIRFGTFQRHAYFNLAANIELLIDHVIENYYPALASVEGVARAPAMLAEVVKAAASMTARWMAAGFVHGVLNTDNMNVTGESFDYGPYRFLPRNDPNFVAAYFDQNGLYAFGRQPEAVLWNLQQLAGALTLASETEPLVEALNGFSGAYRDALRAAMLDRLGLVSRGEEADIVLVNLAFRTLAEAGEFVRWEPFFFDWFGGTASALRALEGPRKRLYEGEQALAFRAALEDFETARPERLGDAYFSREEPEELLYDEIEAIWAPIAEADDWSALNAKLKAVERSRLAWGLG
jgi:uncharacterized protein YdiU (UPF0061 family)